MWATKCSWTLMSFEGNWNKSTLVTQNHNPGDIYMPDEKGRISKVPRYDIEEPRKYLGVIGCGPP